MVFITIAWVVSECKGNLGGLDERTPGGEIFSFGCAASKKPEVLSFLRKGVGNGRTGA